MATSSEEIGRQHAAAQEQIESNAPSMEMVDRGEIPLSWKQQPTELEPELWDDNTHNTRCCISSRGLVDVGPLADLVRVGHNDDSRQYISQSQSQSPSQSQSQSPDERNLWDERNAAVHNVCVTRPSHDKWGIKKIVLVFCDDFLQDVYEFPWWHTGTGTCRPTDIHTSRSSDGTPNHKEEEASVMRRAVQPILDVLQVPQERIVRLLLASLPPGVTIPVHHDTGEWVRHTHRVHVPVLVADPSRILFRCGPHPDATRMKRVDCQPGHVFEMNNQAKHAVSNCHATEHRVHLILDYVDPDFIIRRRTKLAAGETLLQSRRSIDRAVHVGTRPTPTYMILGAQKAGTTSLYDYLTQHPLVIRAKRRETHCLDWRWNRVNNTASSTTTLEQRAAFVEQFYHAKELRHVPSCLTGDSTPSYLIDSRRVIPNLKNLFPHTIQFFVMLRDPVKRAKSHFEMVTSLDGTPEQIKNRGKEWVHMTLEQVIAQDISHMKEDGLLPYWNVETQTVDGDVFQSFAGSKEEDKAWELYLEKRVKLNSGSYSLVARGLYELNLRPWFRAFDSSLFHVIRLEDMANDVQTIMKGAFEHLSLPPYQVKDAAPKNTRSYKPLQTDTKKMLETFYAPHNQRLIDLLSQQCNHPLHSTEETSNLFMWKSDPWPY